MSAYYYACSLKMQLNIHKTMIYIKKKIVNCVIKLLFLTTQQISACLFYII